MSKTVKKIAIGAAIAAVAGYVAGILTAPKSGKETRADIKNKADEAATEAERRLKAMHTELAQLIDQAKSASNKLSGKAKTQYDDLFEKSKVAKQKAREVLSALHEGDAQDEDLQKAIKESSNAIDHLKSYLKKPTKPTEA
jgi:gas vesicle protein